MRVAIDASFLMLNRASGLRTYTRGFIEALLADRTDVDCTLWYNVARDPAGRLCFGERALPTWPGSVPRQILCRWPRRLLERMWRWFDAPAVERFIGDVDVFHSVHLQLPSCRRARRVLTVHDLREFRLPHLYGWLQGGREQRARAARSADRLIAVSEATRLDAIKFFDVDPERVTVAHNGVDAALYAPVAAQTLQDFRTRRQLKRPYLLTLSSEDPRKDVSTALRSARILRERFRWDGELVVAGAMRDDVGTPDGVRIFGVVPDEDLRLLMVGAEALVFCSLYEGFGLPAAEAMAMGTPVVASDTSSLPEVVGDAGVLVPAGDADAFATALRDLLASTQTRDALVARARTRARAFTWQAHAQKVAEVYRALC